MTAAIPALLAGALTWTFLEYWIHRYAGHTHRRNLFAKEHLRHHAQGDYFAPAWKKALLAVIVVGGLGSLGSVVVGPAPGIGFAVGLTGAWLGYEWLHRRLHVHPGRGAYARWARCHHFAHHFVSPRHNHGVTSPVWDWVFGTLRPVDQVPVPDRLAMPWLVVDETTGRIHPDYDDVFVLRSTLRRLRGQEA